MRSSRRFLVSALAGVFLALGAGGEARAAGPRSRLFQITVEQGLSQNTVQAILQDKAGFLWLGTEEGLNRFDGYSFLVFKHDPNDPSSLPDNLVTALFEGRDGRMWVGTQHGLSIFDPAEERFTPIPSFHEKVTAIAEDPDGTLWVGTEGEGLVERTRSGDIVAYRPDAGNPASLSSFIVSALLRDRGGRLWVGTTDFGLEEFVSGGHFRHHRHDPKDSASLSDNDVAALAEDRDGTLYVATRTGGLNTLAPSESSFRHLRHRGGDTGSLGTDLLTSLLVDRSDVLWVGTDGLGVELYDRETGRFRSLESEVTNSQDLGRGAVRTIFEDRQGQLWVGTYLGGAQILRRPNHSFSHYTKTGAAASGLMEPAVSSFLEDRKGRTWVGTEGGWLSLYDRRAGTFTHYRFPSSQPGGAAILSVLEDRKGRLWVGSYRGGLGLFDPERGTFAVLKHRSGDPSSLADDEVWAIAEGRDGSLWLGTNDGLEQFDPDRGVVTAHHPASYSNPGPEELSEGSVQALLEDREGRLWVGTFGGLHMRREGSGGFVRYSHDDKDPKSLDNDSVIALFEDRRGGIWVGTFGGGLSRFDPASGVFTHCSGLPSDVIYGIEQDASGQLWLSSNHGLSRFDPATGRVQSFDLTSGLESLQFKQRASLTSRDGRLLFGGTDGFYDFDPAAIQPDSYAPPVVLTALRIIGGSSKTPVPPASSGSFTLSPKDKVLVIEFAALDFTFPRRNLYAYLLQGFSDAWIPVGNQREVTFTNLDPGTYTFKVKASNADGVWNASSSASMGLVVLPPLWRTWWFEGLAAALLALGLVNLHRLRVRLLTADIASRKRVEDALREAEEKYRGIVENALEGIFQATEDGRFRTVNPALARMLGYDSPEDMLRSVEGREEQLYVDPARLEDLKRLLGQRGSVAGFEVEFKRRDGGVIWASESVGVVRDEQGKALLYQGTAVDISERKRAEAALRQSVSLLRSTLESTADGILVSDRNGCVVSYNERFASMWKIPRSVLDTRDLLAVVAQMLPQTKDQDAFVKKLQELDEDPEAVGFDVVEFTDGRVFERVSYPQRLEKVAIGRVWSFRNITERKRAEAAEAELRTALRRSETMSAMGMLVAGVAHEVRNPLFGISANLDIFETKLGDKRELFTPQIARMRGEVERLATLMQGLLEYGKPLESAMTSWPIDEVVSEAMASCAGLAAEARITICNLVPAGLPAVLMDRPRLVQVFENLLQNAIQHSPGGGVVEVHGVRDGAWVALTIRDSGQGFSAEDLPRAFEPFFSKRKGGTGLGLSIVLRILEEHKGTIEIGNRPEGGALVTVRLPSAPEAPKDGR